MIDMPFDDWSPIAHVARRGTRTTYYRYRAAEGYSCFIECRGLRAVQVIGRVAEVTLEHDVGGLVVVVHRLIEGDVTLGAIRLSSLIRTFIRGT